jgi:hypothetical protein
MYVSQWGGQEKVVRFDALSGAFVDEFTSTGVVNGCGHAWDPAGNLYVASWGTNGTDGNVQRFDSTGVFQGVFTDENLLGPVNIWFGEEGDLFVLDWTQGTVERFNEIDGAHISTFVSGMENSEGFVFGPDGFLYICDWTLNHVNRYHPDGTLEGVFASGANLTRPNSVTFGPENPVSSPHGPTPARGLFLGQNQPNPFSQSTQIGFDLTEPGEVSLTIFNALGQRLSTLVEGRHSVGHHAVSWSAPHLPGGVYFYRLQAGELTETKKMTVLK